jgi:hypothetical protein
VFWVSPSNSWGSTSGHAIDVANFKQISFWAAIDGPTPYTVNGAAVPFVGQAGGIDPKGRYASMGGVDYVDGVSVNGGWNVNDPTDPANSVNSTMKQFHIPFGPFDKGKGCQDPAQLSTLGKAENCSPTDEASFMNGTAEATFLIGAFAWALHYPIDQVTCKTDPAVPDCHMGNNSADFLNPTPIHIYLDDIVWDTEAPPSP